jgi:hypothetical protein
MQATLRRDGTGVEPAVARRSRRRNARRLVLRIPEQFFHTCAYCKMPKPIKHFGREVRRARHLSAWIKVQDRAIAECQVMDISNNGAKIVTATSSAIPDHFQLAFFSRGSKPELRSNLAARQGFWRQVCSVRCSPKITVGSRRPVFRVSVNGCAARPCRRSRIPRIGPVGRLWICCGQLRGLRLSCRAVLRV